MPRTQPSMVVCEHCGLAHRWVPLSPSGIAKCSRCEAVLGRGHRIGVDALLALTLAALIVFVIANTSHIITINLNGNELTTTFPMAIAATWREGEHLVAVVAAVSALAAPALFIGLRLYLLVPLAAGRVPAGFALCLRMLFQASRWNTIEVLTVGALFALGTLALLLAAIDSAGLRHLWWHVR